MKISGCMIKRLLASAAGLSELWGRQTGSWAIKGECSAYVGAFSVATDAGKPFCGRLVFYIYTPDIFTFTLIAHRSSSFSLSLPTSPSHGVCMYVRVCMHVCVSVNAPTDCRVSLQSVCRCSAHFAFHAPRSRGSHFSIAYCSGTSLLRSMIAQWWQLQLQHPQCKCSYECLQI